MRKIDKSLKLATAYHEWHDALNEPHPEYISSKNEYYRDIVMNLFACQDGVCAYTEMRLCDLKHAHPNRWQNGRYIDQKFKFQGQLDHFDPRLKSQKAWAWDNFFMVHTDLNTKVKGTEIPNNRLKPDGNDYDPIALLEYNLKTHRYTTKDENLAETLLILGINQQFVVDERRRYISDYLADLDLFGLDDMVIDCFFTAIMLIEKEREP